jgi:hypothetical protein
VKNHFLPVYIAKKDRQSLPFFGVKATKLQDHAGMARPAKDFVLGFHGLNAGARCARPKRAYAIRPCLCRREAQTYPEKARVCFLTNTMAFLFR